MPEHIRHGHYMPMMKMYTPHDRIYYKCDDGYQMYYQDDWYEYATCMEDGYWNYKPPMCRDMKKSKINTKH